MIRRIELVNFMSHARTVIEPADGLTVLVGPNNCGKSAVVTALQILCHNDNSTYVTRHNERECTVTVETSDGHIVEWCRKNNSPRYTVNGQLFDRLGRGSLPDGLHNALRLAKVTAEGNQEFDVHFGEQKSPVFLLDKPGSHAAQFFASSSDAASLVEMQKRHQQKVVDARRERNQLEARALRLTADLAILAATDQIGANVGEIESKHEELGRLTLDIEQLTQDARELEQAIALLNHYGSEATAFGTLALPPLLVNLQPLEEMIGKLTRTQVEMERQSAQAVFLSSLQVRPEFVDDQSLAGLLRALQSAQILSARVDARCVAYGELVQPPPMIETATMRVTMVQIGLLSHEVAASEEQLTVLEPLASVPKLDNETFLAHDVQTLTRAASALLRTEAIHRQLYALIAAPELADAREIEVTIRDITGAATAFTSHTRDLEQAEQALREGERLLRTWAEQKQLCPTCGGPVDPNQLIAHAGSCGGGQPHA